MEKLRMCLADDIFVEILLKLPVKSVGRFMSVCKSWYQIISSTSFINAHKNTISNTNSPYLLCDHRTSYSLLHNEELTNYKPCYDDPKLFGVKLRDLRIKVYDNCEAFSRPELATWGTRVKVRGSCKGLLCVSESHLTVDSIIYFLNPIIRKAKRIPKICIGGQGQLGDVELCLGYFDNDYKLIKIAVSSRGYRVGVYSLRTDCWKTINCDQNSDHADNDCKSRFLFYPKNARFVNGVAYFLRAYKSGIISFDLCDERMREIMLPQNIDQSDRNHYTSYDLEVYQESIAFVDISKHVMDMWVLKICGVTKISAWEKKVKIGLEGTAAYTFPVGFLNNNTYLLRKKVHPCIFYLCNLENSECKRFTDRGGQRGLSRIDSFVGNLVLLNEDTIDPFAETAPGSASNPFLFEINCEKITARKKEKKERLHKRQEKLEQGRNTKRKIAKTVMEKK